MTSLGHAQLNPFSPASIEIDAVLQQLIKEHDSSGRVIAPETRIKWLQKRAEVISREDILYAGVVHLYLGFYSNRAEERRQLMDTGIRYLSGQPEALFYFYPAQLRALVYAFGEAGRIDEWRRADSLLRIGAQREWPEAPTDMALAVLASNQVQDNEYERAREILAYDINFTAIYNSVDRIADRLRLQFDQVLYFIAELKQYLDIPYSKRVNIPLPGEALDASPETGNAFLEKMQQRDRNEDFTRLVDSMNVIHNELAGHAGDQPALQQFYHELYASLLVNFSSWASLEGYPGRAILPLKIYMADELLPAVRAQESKAVPLLPVDQFTKLFTTLSQLYLNVGSYAEAAKITDSAFAYFSPQTHWPVAEKTASGLELLIMASKANRLRGDTSKAMQLLQQAENSFLLPDSLQDETREALINFCKIRLEKIYGLLESQQPKKAFTLLGELYDRLDSLKGMDEGLLIDSDLWPDMLYLGADFLARKGSFNHGFINESVKRSFNNEDLDIGKKYQGLLLMYKMRWNDKLEATTQILPHLLHFTERQLRHNFILLDPEERMQFYENNLVKLFGLYHELLFSGELDSLPRFKESILEQTLFLKSAMGDGNVYPEELLDGELEADGKKASLRYIKRITNLLGVNDALYKRPTGNIELTRNKLQLILIRELQDRSLKVEMPFPQWKAIAAKLEKGSVYLEFVRYRSMLTDSTDRYGALLIEPGKDILALPLCTEKDLTDVLKNAGASPQSASLVGSATRGNEVLGRKPATNTFKAGDKDKLGALVLDSLWKYIADKKTLYYVPDGLLNRISFAALGWQGKYLLQLCSLKQLSNCSGLLRPEAPMPQKGNVLIAGGIDYGKLPGNKSTNSRFVAGLSWDYLPGTREEADILNTLFMQKGYSTALITDTAFTNTAAYKVDQYDFVHLSTHGFYFNSEEAMKVINDRFNRETIRENPLTRSGLVLSDANDPALYIDGYLMGYELSNLDLRKCYLATLSACETGLGDIRNNMGVDGLPRALSIAGAKKLLITLWKVPDKPTVVFMQKFYAALLSGKPPSVALRETQLWMADKYPVAAWAAFCLIE